MIRKKSWALWAIVLLLVIVSGLIWLILSRPVITWDMVNVNTGQNQGDAHVLRIADKTVLIDAGYYVEAQKNLIPFLQKSNIQRIDYFFISHPHRDHYEGALALLEAGISIETMLFKEPARDVSDCCYSRSHLVWFVGKIVASGTRIFKPETGYQLQLPLGSSLELLHAQEGNFPDQAVDVNDLSMVMRWNVYGRRVLFTGDLNHTVGEYLASDSRMQADILKIPHHGGRGIVPNAFYDQVGPDAALVPGPEWVWCGERGQQTRRWVEDHQVPTWVNGTDGHVQVAFSFTDVQFDPPQPAHQCRDKTAELPVFALFKRLPSIGEVAALVVAGLRARWHQISN